MNRITLISALLAILFAMGKTASAQDIYFSQQYADKLSLNPAHPAIQGNSEICVIMRQQFPQAQGGFKTYGASYLQKINQCGIGIRAYGTTSGGAYTQNNFSAAYANMVRLSKKIKCSAAVEVAFATKNLKQNKLVYYSMLDPLTGDIKGTPPSIEYTSPNTLAMSTGIILYTKKSAAGLAAYNIAQYKISSTEGISKAFTGFVNHKIELKKTFRNHQAEPCYLIPNIIIRYQNNISSIQTGLHIDTPVIIGGLSHRLQTGAYTQHSIIATIGVTIKNIQIGYGHDFNLSNTIKADYGAHEIAAKYIINNIKKNTNGKTIFCPAY